MGHVDNVVLYLKKCSTIFFARGLLTCFISNFSSINSYCTFVHVKSTAFTMVTSQLVVGAGIRESLMRQIFSSLFAEEKTVNWRENAQTII